MWIKWNDGGGCDLAPPLQRRRRRRPPPPPPRYTPGIKGNLPFVTLPSRCRSCRCRVGVRRAFSLKCYFATAFMRVFASFTITGWSLEGHRSSFKSNKLVWTTDKPVLRIIQPAAVCYYNRIITRFSIQTAGLAFGGTGLCSYRVRGVVSLIVNDSKTRRFQ